jgi:hypothetical protein
MNKKRLAAPYSDYAVTDTGKVISYKRNPEGEPVAEKTDKDSYPQVNLSNNEEAHGFKVFRVHDLVARAFLGPRPEGAEVLHKDGKRNNNAASNLKYGSRSENAKQRESDKRNDAIDVADLGDDWQPDFRLDLEDDDYIRLDSTFEIGKWERTPEGYLKATAIVAREDTLDYPDEGRSEFVSEEALKSGAETLLHKPVTMEHPSRGEVDDGDWKQHAVGIVVESRYDSDLRAIVAGIVVYDRAAIAAVLEHDIREVSPGYRAAVVKDPTYGFRQVRRASNHLAITRAGRGGPEASIRLDSKGRTATHEEQMTDEEKEKLKAKADAAEKEAADAKSKLDALQAKVDAYEKMAKEKDEEKDEAKNDSNFVALFNERTEALDLAQRLDARVDDQMTNTELKAAIVAKRLGKDLRNDSKEVLQGAYEAVKAMTPTKNSPEHLGSVFASNIQRNDAIAQGAENDLFSAYDNRNDSTASPFGQFQFTE